jgi:hypothetical protein
MSSTTHEPDTAVDADVLRKVRALLTQAERTTFADEADTFTAKAQQLMARYRIDRALLDEPAGDRAGPRRRELRVDDPYAQAKAYLYHRVALTNGCETVYTPHLKTVTLFGSPADLELVETLTTSLLVQAALALQAIGPRRDDFGRSTTRSFRRSFYLAFGRRIGERLRTAVDETHATLDDEVRSRALPVLADRAVEVRAAVRRAFPHLDRRPTTVSNGAGWHAGRLAADAADLSVRSAVGASDRPSGVRSQP